MSNTNIFKQFNGSVANLVNIPAVSGVLALVARVFASAIFITAGYGKLGAGYAGTQAYMAAMGVPAAMLPLVIALELGGGIALLLGFQTRLGGIAAGRIQHHRRTDIPHRSRPDAADHADEEFRDGRRAAGIHDVRCRPPKLGRGNTGPGCRSADLIFPGSSLSTPSNRHTFTEK